MKAAYALTMLLLATPALAHAPHSQTGIASWYGKHWRGRKTASGQRFNPEALTCASRHLPLGTKVRVSRVDTHRSVVLTVNDRGPYVGGRIIDVSHHAAVKLDLVRAGTAKVRVQPLG